MKRRSMKRVSVKKENKTFKTLAVATIVGLSIIGVGQAQAATLDEVDLSQKPIDTPTLDYLHNNDVQIKDENGTEVAIPQSSYTMTNVEANSDGSKPAGDNIITKYDYDKTTGSLSPLYYEINHQTQFGNPDGDTTLNFEYTSIRTDFLGQGLYFKGYKITEDNTITPSATYKYSTNSNYQDIISNTLNLDTPISGTGGYDPYIFEGGASINNPANTTISIDNKVFKGNISKTNITSSDTAFSILGGAIVNHGNITHINADFIKNSATDEWNHRSKGGAIYNNGTIGDINGNFIENIASTGSAIYNNNNAIIGNINGDFIKNGTEGAVTIYNGKNSIIGNINGDFISNGRTIYNNGGKIGNITGDFIANNSDYIDYAIIYNNENSSIGTITGSFLGNGMELIENKGNIDNIYATFVQNGGTGITNTGTIKAIVADFISNGGSEGYGGGDFTNIYNSGNIDYIIGDSINSGGIYNTGKIKLISGDYINSDRIKNEGGTIDKIEGTFTNDKVVFPSKYEYDNLDAGIVNTYSSNPSLIKLILADFIANQGGGISNIYGVITDVIGSFIGNSISLTTPKYSNQAVYGGAIYNADTLGSSTVSYIGNISGTFLNNYVSIKDNDDNIGSALGGAVYNGGRIDSITNSLFQNNHAEAERGNAFGGAIYNTITRHYYGKDGVSGIGKIQNTSFIGNYAKSESGTAQGGAIWSNRDLNIIADNGKSLFSGNYVQNGDKKDQQAIFVTNIIEEKYLGYSHSHSFYQKEPHKTTVTLNSINNGKIIFNDKITSAGTTKTPINKYYEKWDSSVGKWTLQYVDDDYNDIDTPTEVSVTPELKITGDSSSVVQLNNNIENMDISLSGTNLHLGARDNVLDGNNLDLQSGTLSMVNNQAGVASLNNVTLSGNTNFVADVDLANEQMDRITANNYNTQQGINLNVVGMNLLSDATKDVTEIYFAQPGLKNNVVNGMPANGGYNLPSSAQTTFYTPIYKYNAIYDNRNDGGYFMFTKGDKILTANGGGGTTITPTGNPSDAFNPSVLAPSVASQAGANATMNQTFNYAFQNSDNFMTIPYLERVAIKTANRYALSPTGDATDVGTFSLLFNAQNETSSAWVKPYASFENIPLKNGPKVSNITYGTLVGFDTPIKSIRHGWDRTWTGYVGYNGASQRFSGVDATQNGGLVGGTLTLYKGNFFNATTISSGAIVGDNRTMYGTDNYTMLMAGVGNKTGYNFEFKEGKIIIQPSMLLSYTFVNTFDYTNAAGVRIKNDPLHAIQIAPGVKFIVNTKNGWQPYIGVNMIWNLLDKSKVSADDVRLPEMSIKPYVQYGVGIQKRFKDRYMAFGQAMIQNGGRNGISLTAGFRWAIGKEGKPLEKVQRVNNKVSSVTPRAEVKVANNSTVQPERKIIKQLTSEQRVRLGARPQDTTRTTALGSLRQI